MLKTSIRQSKKSIYLENIGVLRYNYKDVFCIGETIFIVLKMFLTGTIVLIFSFYQV